MSIQEKFEKAVNVIRNLPKNGSFQPSRELQLRFYAYFKQATEGPNPHTRPSFWEIVKRAKWDAWSNLGNMSKEDAMVNYVDELQKIVETMSYTDNVANFMDSLDNCTNVSSEDLEFLVGSIIKSARSRPNSPLIGSREGSPCRDKSPLDHESRAVPNMHNSSLDTSPASSYSISPLLPDSEDEEDFFLDTETGPDKEKEANGIKKMQADKTFTKECVPKTILNDRIGEYPGKKVPDGGLNSTPKPVSTPALDKPQSTSFQKTVQVNNLEADDNGHEKSTDCLLHWEQMLSDETGAKEFIPKPIESHLTEQYPGNKAKKEDPNCIFKPATNLGVGKTQPSRLSNTLQGQETKSSITCYMSSPVLEGPKSQPGVSCEIRAPIYETERNLGSALEMGKAESNRLQKTSQNQKIPASENARHESDAISSNAEAALSESFHRSIVRLVEQMGILQQQVRSLESKALKAQEVLHFNIPPAPVVKSKGGAIWWNFTLPTTAIIFIWPVIVSVLYQWFLNRRRK